MTAASAAVSEASAYPPNLFKKGLDPRTLEQGSKTSCQNNSFKVLIDLFQKVAEREAEPHGHGVSFLPSFFLAPAVSKKKAKKMNRKAIGVPYKSTPLSRFFL